jgi:DNA-binding NarL/FixJ family response regulator
MMTRSLDEPSLADALHAGVTGFLGLDSSPDELTHAVQLVATGNSVLSRGVARKVFERVHEPRPVRGKGRAALPLSERESEVLDLLARGLSNVQIGNRLLLSPATVKDHISSIYTKLGVSNRVQAAVLAVQNRPAGRHSPDSPGLCAPAC